MNRKNPITLKGLMNEYFISPEYLSLSPRTKRIYQEALFRGVASINPVEEQPLLLLSRQNLLKARDGLSTTPAIANQFVTAISVLMNFAVDRGYRDDNPALRMKKLKCGEWSAWEEEELESLLQHLNTDCGPLYTTVLLAVYTAQRKGDLISLRWEDYRSGCFAIRQQKTGTTVIVPCHPVLQAHLEKIMPPSPTGHIIRNESGNPMTPSNLSKLWQRAIKKSGVRGKTFHGLRKTAAKRLAEAGCTEREIMSITGHKTSHMVSFYTKMANQTVMARSAMQKLCGEKVYTA